MSQQPRVALVVGAGDYIGAAIAKRFAAGGFTVALGRRHAEKLEPLVAEIAASGGAARAFALDARDEANVQEVFATVEKELGPLELVVFNVGANVSFPITETTSRVFRKVWGWRAWAASYRPRGGARHAAAAARLDLLHRRDGEPARRQGLRGLRVSEVRPARARARSRAARPGSHPCCDIGDRRRRRHRVRARAHPGCGPRSGHAGEGSR